MEINAQTSATASTGASGTGNQSENQQQVISSDFETFLRMLTTQLENQDPLNPIESQDFAVQLATFSSVEQQVLTNDLIRELKDAMGASGLSQLAGWVGMEARVAAPVRFSGQPIDIAVTTQPGSDRAELVVRSEFGVEVAREAVPLGNATFTWAGTGSSGSPLPFGTYSLEVESYSLGENIGTSEVPHYARVTEARQGLDGVDLVIDGGRIVPASDVSGLREPGSAVLDQ